MKYGAAALFVFVLALNVKMSLDNPFSFMNEEAVADVTTHECPSGQIWGQAVQTNCYQYVDCDGDGNAETPCGMMIVIKCNTNAAEQLKSCCTESTTTSPDENCCEPE